MTVGRPYYESRGPGYSVYYPTSLYAADYSFYPGKYTGDYRAGRFATTNGRYATMPSGYSPIMMTSLNYPEVYGSYTVGLGPSGSVAPPLQTLPDNPPSDNPVGAPYAPLSRPLADVPRDRSAELTTTTLTATEPRAKPALIDVQLPAAASLSFQGVPMSDTGSQREFQSPPLLPGRSYTYEVRATWRKSDGSEVVRTRQLTVRAGDHLEVDLNRELTPRPDESENEQPMLRTLPAPLMRDARPAPKD